ncbi:MAG: hypothetical protein JO026_03895 [Patescibacteria group bacterium]|nr:hypothetical protein [Patescibacteria group bacterium]
MRLFVPIVLLVIALGIFFGYINPTYAHVRTLLLQESQYDEALSRAKELQGVRDELISRYNTFSQSDLARIQKLLPDHVDNVRLILDLDSMASKYGMRVKDVSIDQSAVTTTKASPGGITASTQQLNVSQQIGSDNKPYESVVLSFSVTGTYDSFRQYLADLERSLRISDVTGITFVPNDTGIYDFTIHLKTYWLKP